MATEEEEEEEEEAVGRGEGRVSLCDGIFKLATACTFVLLGSGNFPLNLLNFL